MQHSGLKISKCGLKRNTTCQNSPTNKLNTYYPDGLRCNTFSFDFLFLHYILLLKNVDDLRMVCVKYLSVGTRANKHWKSRVSWFVSNWIIIRKYIELTEKMSDEMRSVALIENLPCFQEENKTVPSGFFFYSNPAISGRCYKTFTRHDVSILRGARQTAAQPDRSHWGWHTQANHIS